MCKYNIHFSLEGTDLDEDIEMIDELFRSEKETSSFDFLLSPFYLSFLI